MSVVRSETRIDIFPFPPLFSSGDAPKSVKPQREVSFHCSLLLEVRPPLLPRALYPHPSSGHQPLLLRLLREASSIAVSAQRGNGCSCQGCDCHSSWPLQSAGARQKPKKRQWEVSLQFLRARLTVIMTHRQLCLCQRPKEINFWPSFIAQVFAKLV